MEDFLFQIENKDAKKTNKMSYPRFTKVIINHFMLKDQSISRRNKMFWHTAQDDTMFTSMRCISRHEDTQVYGTLLQKHLTNEAMLESKAYQTYYAFASREKAPKPKYIQKKADSDTSPKNKHVQATKAEQLKLATKRSKNNFHMSYASGSGDGVDIQSKVPNEQQQKTSGTDEGTGTIPRVPDVPTYESESKKESWGDSEDEDDNDDDDDGDNDDDGDSDDHEDDSDDERTESDKDEIPDPKLTNVDQTKHEEEEYDDEFYEEEDEENIDDEETMYDDEDDEVTKELYEDANVNLGNVDTEMTNADQGASNQQNVSQQLGFEKVEEDAHVTITLVHDTQKADEPLQSSSVSSDFTRKLLNLDNPSPADNEIASLMETSYRHATAIPENISSFTTTIPLPPPFFNPLQQEATPTSTPTTSETTTSLLTLLDFASVFKFNERIFSLEKEAINKAILTHNLDCQQEAQDEKNAYIEIVDTLMRALIKEEVNTQLPLILRQAVSDFATPVIEKNVTESVEAAVLTRQDGEDKSYDKADYKKKLYDALVESYNTEEDLFDSYEETEGEAMINSIQNGDHPLPVIAQVSLAGTALNIDRLARSLLIQGLPNDIYSLIDSNDTAKDLWDALERQMRGSDLGLYVLRMERGFLSKKGSGGGREVKEKNVVIPPLVEDPGLEDWWGYKGSGDATNTQIDENISGPTANVAANVIVSPRGPIPSGPTSKRVAYPVVANYVRNTWGKYGLVKSMLNSSTRLFFFQFRSMDSLDSMLENGLWFIRNNPLILKKWNPDVNLMKEDAGNVSVWVKLHGVLVMAFNEDGLSAIATKLGTHLMLKSYTSDMCIQSWGRSSYARALIEIRGDVELKDTIVVVMPKLVGERFYTCTIHVKYEWKPLSQAPRGVQVRPNVGFKPAKQVYRPVSKKTNAKTSGNKNKDAESTKEDEVESVDNEMTSFLVSKKVGYDTNSLLEQWKETYENANYDYDSYDDDMYEDQEILDNIQSMCDNLYIKVRGRKNK
ncbi:copia protein [Tanacetum coccineum]